MKPHIPYKEVTNRNCDFIVKYKFYIGDNGRRPIQGYRSDFKYFEDNDNKLWMIWPEFLNKELNIITDKTIEVDLEGNALMWIINSEMIDRHKERIKIGQKGFFMEGSKKVAECEVIEVIFK